MTVRHLTLVRLLLVAAVLSCAPAAYAGPFRLLGYDTQTMATANSNIAYGASPGVLYSNPALLGRMPKFQMFINVMYWKPQFSIELFDKPAGSDVPVTIYKSNMGNDPLQQDLPLPTVELFNPRADNDIDDFYAYVSFGMVAKLFKVVTVGSIMTIPIDSLNIFNMVSNFPDEREQYFTNTVHMTRFGEWSSMVDGVLGASYVPIPELSIGVSLKIGVSSVAKVDMYMPDASVQDYSLAKTNMEMQLALKPIVGIQANPLDWLSIGTTWRYWSYMDIDGGGKMKLYQFKETDNDFYVPKFALQSYQYALDYEPMEFSGGVGISLAGFTTQINLTWNMWHFYLDNMHNSPQTAAHFPTSPFYEDPVTDDGMFKFKDTVTVAWGGQYKYWDTPSLCGEVLAGFQYNQSPVPPQVGRTNYADSDTYAATLGHKLDIEVDEDVNLGIDVAFQYWHMVTRETYKDPAYVVDEFADASRTVVGNLPMSEAQGLQSNNPGYPGYRVGGHMFVASLNLRLDFAKMP